MKKVFFYLFLVTFFACKKNDNKIEFNIVQVNDVYEIGTMEGGKVGGLSRVATIVNDLRKENENTLLMHAGDFLNPSLIGTLKDENGERYRGKQMIAVMNAMKFDLVVLGNHEFDLSYPDLQKRFNESNFQWIATDVKLRSDGKTMPFYKMKDSVKEEFPKTFTFNLIDDDGTELKLGFFSATVPSNNKEYVVYGDLYQDAINAYKKLEPTTDIVLGLTHVALNQDKLIANSLPKVPLLIGGHEHTNMLIPVGDAVIAKADANARTVYIHRITYDKKTKETTVNSELKHVTDEIPDDPEVAAVVDKWTSIMDEKLKGIINDPYKVIYTTNIPLEGRDKPIRSVQTNLGQLIAKAMENSYEELDCAIINGGSIRIDDQLNGDITGVDIFRVLPFGGGIQKVSMTGELLERVLNYGRLKAGTGAYLQYASITYNNDTRQWQVGGKPIKKSKVYKLALTDYLLLGFDIPFLKIGVNGLIKVHPNPEISDNNDIRKVVINYISEI